MDSYSLSRAAAARVVCIGAVVSIAVGLTACESEARSEARKAKARAEQVAIEKRRDQARALEAERANAEEREGVTTAHAKDRIAMDYAASNAAARKTGIGRICRAAIATVMGRDPGTIRAAPAPDATTDRGMTVHTRYTRSSDGTVWRNECSVAGNRVLWSAIDADGTVGRKRLEDRIYYSARGSSITIKLDIDGERVSEKTYIIQ